jgi:hypothetical protein
MRGQYKETVDDAYEWRDIDLPGAQAGRQAVADWQIISVGRRPIDYMGRDLLIGSWLRDGRLWPMRRFSNSCPQWAGEMTLELRSKPVLRKQAIQVIGANFLQMAHLARMKEMADGAQAEVLIERLSSCWPYGLELE